MYFKSVSVRLKGHQLLHKSLSFQMSRCLWVHHFADIHCHAKDTNWERDGHDQMPDPYLKAAVFLRWAGLVGLSVEQDWQNDEADATDAATEKGKDEIDVGEEGRHGDDHEWNR